jgi:hypothetical protein
MGWNMAEKIPARKMTIRNCRIIEMKRVEMKRASSSRVVLLQPNLCEGPLFMFVSPGPDREALILVFSVAGKKALFAELDR